MNITGTFNVNGTNMTNVTVAVVANNRTVVSSAMVRRSDVITTHSYNDQNTVPSVFASAGGASIQN